MSNILEYNRLISSTQRIPRSRILPKNVYRISLYKYEGKGRTKRLVGNETALIFVIGKVGDKVHAIKISELPPTDFFQFLKTMLADTISEERITSLADYLVKSSIQGDELYNKYVKGNSMIDRSKGNKGGVYRTYVLDNIQYLSVVNFEQNVLDEVFDIRSNNTIDNITVTKEVTEDQTLDERGIE